MASQLPASVLVMNLPRDKWQHKHLKSLMHESGHALNNLLASQPYEILSGIRLPLDLVEVPAKVLERLAWDPKVHKAITGIARTPAPDNRQSGIALDERILKSAMALAYHQSGKPDMEAINAELYQKYLHQAYIPGLSPQYAFRHLASYGPAYFTYLYSDAEAADISDAIQQGQLSLAQFADCMLKPGGSIPARDQLACATTVDQGAPRHTSVLTPLLLALTTPALAANPIQVPTAEEASTGIQQQLEHHLYQLPPRVQGHYGIRLWRLTR